MRWVYLAIVVLLGLATLIFALQNLEIVSIDFLSISLRTPLALMVVVVYLAGMATGGSLWALVRRSIRGARLGGTPPP